MRIAPPALLIALAATAPLVAGCRLPAREWRWSIGGPATTRLASLGEARGCGLVLRLWAAPRSMWPLPLPNSWPLITGREDLFLLAVIDNRRASSASFDPSRGRVGRHGPARIAAPRDGGPDCPASIGPGAQAACGFTVPIPRGAREILLDLREAAPCDGDGFVFRLSREASWRWRRVGPGVPGL